MRRHPLARSVLIIVAVAGVSWGGLGVASATGVPERPAEITFTGAAIGPSRCSASVVRFTSSKLTDKALGLTNAHCLPQDIGHEFWARKPVNETFTLKKADGTDAGQVASKLLVYGSQTVTDVALYELDFTYDEIRSRFGVTPLTLAEQGPRPGTALTVLAGHFAEKSTCVPDRQVMAVEMEGPDSPWQVNGLHYDITPTCRPRAGYSGSPVIDPATGHQVGIHSSGNGPVTGCTGYATCEVAAGGVRTAVSNSGYMVQTSLFYSCLNTRRQVDLTTPRCTLHGGASALRRPW